MERQNAQGLAASSDDGLKEELRKLQKQPLGRNVDGVSIP